MSGELIHKLPHSYPFVFIDRISEFEEGKRIVCLKNISMNEKFFQGQSVVSNIFIIEAMAQASGLLISDMKPKMVYLNGIKDARFERKVLTGDQLIVISSISHSIPPHYIFDVVARVKDELVSSAMIILAVL
jgi:3-hydroxymyristoyl/3-hydroxydecanoyl-(acyl carrier protein) dehydratase